VFTLMELDAASAETAAAIIKTAAIKENRFINASDGLDAATRPRTLTLSNQWLTRYSPTSYVLLCNPRAVGRDVLSQ
jgi:hypothetical protein